MVIKDMACLLWNHQEDDVIEIPIAWFSLDDNNRNTSTKKRILSWLCIVKQANIWYLFYVETWEVQKFLQ